MLLIAIVCASGASAERLAVPADAGLLQNLGAAALLYSHIIGGIIGLLAGTVALVVRKGGNGHRSAGKAFLFAMAITYLVGAGVAPFLNEGQRPNFVAGVLALYLLWSGVSAARRRPFVASMSERVGLVIALIITGMGVTFMLMGMQSTSGTVDGSPPDAFVLFIVVGSAAAIGELNALFRGSLSPAARITRHLWRMCVSFFIASGSLFFGQAQLFPDTFNASLAPTLLALLPLLAMVFFLLRSRRPR
ncbi:MAG: hypothetical protein AAGJ86_11575 [Pseudomonadota bacterium]